MYKLLSSASVLAILTVAPALAQTTPPATSQDKSPSMTQGQTPSTPSTGQSSSTPSMTQDKSATSPSASQPSTTTAMTMTEDEAKKWVDKSVYSSDGQELGEVAEIKRSSDNKVTELHADIGGFLGMGESRVKVEPSEFTLQGDRVVLNLTAEQAKALPKMEK